VRIKELAAGGKVMVLFTLRHRNPCTTLRD
jgi:hypothetical protein